MAAFIKKSILLSFIYFSISSLSFAMNSEGNIKDEDEDEHLSQSPPRIKQEITYSGTPEKPKSKPFIDTPLKLEVATLENTRLQRTVESLQHKVDSLVLIITDDRFVRPAFAHLFSAIIGGQDDRTIGNLLRRVDEVRRPQFLELPVDFDKKIRRSVTESTLYLMNNELNVLHATRTNFPTINYLRFKPFRDVSTQDVRNLTTTLRNLAIRNNEEDQTPIGRRALKKLVSKSLKEPVINLETEIDLSAFPKLKVHQYNDRREEPGIYEWYMVGSAIPDGDCFFHAIFTQDGEIGNVVSQRASQIRTRVVEETSREEDSQRTMRLEILGYYREMIYRGRTDLVSDNIKKMLEKNDYHSIIRNSLLEKENGDVEKLPEKFRNSVKYDDNVISGAISLHDIQQYMVKYLNPENDEYYIEVPVGRDSPAGISELIARKNNITVNYFVLNQERASLNYTGTLAKGNPTIYNLLVYGNHFYPLYNVIEGKAKKSRFIQSLNNSIDFVRENYLAKPPLSQYSQAASSIPQS